MPGLPAKTARVDLRAAAQGGPRVTELQPTHRAARGAAADRRPPLRAVLRRQRALGQRHVVPEPRRVAARLPADGSALLLGVLNFSQFVLDRRARALDGQRRRPLRPAAAAARDADRVRGDLRPARAARASRDHVGTVVVIVASMLLGIVGAFAAPAQQALVTSARRAARHPHGRLAQLDDVQHRPRQSARCSPRSSSRASGSRPPSRSTRCRSSRSPWRCSSSRRGRASGPRGRRCARASPSCARTRGSGCCCSS